MRLREQDRRIVFVPTMGNLHAGHLRLMEEARHHGDVVAVSIYVNPMQFAPNEDFGNYPRTLEEDKEKLDAHGIDLLFLPTDKTIYLRGVNAQTIVEVPGLSDELCGATRPGHFRGVTTVVNRLLNLVEPHVAIFGKKDYQQLLLIQLMVQDLGLPVEIVGVETVREADGLACSSRNGYLTESERGIAPKLYETLCALRGRLMESGRVATDLERQAVQALEAVGFQPEYVSIRRRQDLGEPGPDDRKLIVLAAAWLGKTRLIDNLECDLNL